MTYEEMKAYINQKHVNQKYIDDEKVLKDAMKLGIDYKDPEKTERVTEHELNEGIGSNLKKMPLIDVEQWITIVRKSEGNPDKYDWMQVGDFNNPDYPIGITFSEL